MSTSRLLVYRYPTVRPRITLLSRGQSCIPGIPSNMPQWGLICAPKLFNSEISNPPSNYMAEQLAFFSSYFSLFSSYLPFFHSFWPGCESNIDGAFSMRQVSSSRGISSTLKNVSSSFLVSSSTHLAYLRMISTGEQLGEIRDIIPSKGVGGYSGGHCEVNFGGKRRLCFK